MLRYMIVMERSILVAIPVRYRRFVDEEISLVRTVYDNYSIEHVFVKKPNPKYYLSMNTIEKLKNSDRYEKIVVMDLLKPRHFINLIRVLGRVVVDRMQLILEIFALHAGSKEALLQIELARLRHQLPLIKESIRYAKLGELHGFLGGGRYGYEKYYTMAKKRMARIKRRLEELRRIREIRRRAREKLGYPHIALVGYTCAGKTTLFNYLTKQYKPIGPEPFTTLTPKAGAIIHSGLKLIVIDTVGFIRDIPHEIIEAFYATLAEITYSDVIVNIVDVSKSLNEVFTEVRETDRILRNIGVHGKPVLYALNKVDKVSTNHLYKAVDSITNELEISRENIIPISAIRGVNINLLLDRLLKVLKR